MAKLYTQTGDKGETGLLGGERVLKSTPRIDLYGEIDTLNSLVGLIIAHLSSRHPKRLKEALEKIQHQCFHLGAFLAGSQHSRKKFNLSLPSPQIVKFLENEIDFMSADLPPLKNFILPGGGKVASFLHVARTKARKVERKWVALWKAFPEEYPLGGIVFLNRLSDYFFVSARWGNQSENIQDVIWAQNPL